MKNIRIITWGGLGDAAIISPSFKAIKEKYTKSRLIVYANKLHRQLYEHNPHIDSLQSISPILNPAGYVLKRLKPEEFVYVNYGHWKPSIYYRGIHAMQTVGEMLGLKIKDPVAQVFLSDKENQWAVDALRPYKIPVLLQITSTCSSNQDWPFENWEKLIAKMPHIDFIQVGLENEPKIKGAISFLGKTSIRESLALLNNSSSFIAVESFFNNVSSAFNAPGVVLFGPSTPANWGYSNNINLHNEKLTCSPCIDILRDRTCPYGKECMATISVDRVQAALEKQLSKQMKGYNKDKPHVLTI
ncbi:glycosyltransferase family 9 protein [Fulvivirga sp.]|uniref:glycosyltransferase family 9 protein n=1 Tax=Fulvivirga sp. TaxID=1931237 RepID=UPI0032EFC342